VTLLLLLQVRKRVLNNI